MLQSSKRAENGCSVNWERAPIYFAQRDCLQMSGSLESERGISMEIGDCIGVGVQLLSVKSCMDSHVRCRACRRILLLIQQVEEISRGYRELSAG